MSEPGPIVIGGIGGSGTGVVAQVLQAGGIHMGSPRNASWDALTFLDSYHKWVEIWDTSPDHRLTVSDWDDLAKDFMQAIDTHLKTCRPGPWGWKLTGAIHFVKLLNHLCWCKAVTGDNDMDMTFVHVIRDGRDVVSSRSQQQYGDHGAALLAGRTFNYPDGPDPNPTAGRRMAFWSMVNDRAADEGERLPRGRYARITFEGLCMSPLEEVTRLYEALGIDADPELGARIVKPPATLGRWQRMEPQERELLNAIGFKALRRLGYRETAVEIRGTVERTLGGRPPLDPAVPSDFAKLEQMAERDWRTDGERIANV